MPRWRGAGGTGKLTWAAEAASSARDVGSKERLPWIPLDCVRICGPRSDSPWKAVHGCVKPMTSGAWTSITRPESTGARCRCPRAIINHEVDDEYDPGIFFVLTLANQMIAEPGRGWSAGPIGDDCAVTTDAVNLVRGVWNAMDSLRHDVRMRAMETK